MGCGLTGGSLVIATATPIPTEVPTPTATPTAVPSPTLTPTPDIWGLNSLLEYGQLMGLLGELYGDVVVLDLAMRPEAALFIIFTTSEGELLVAEIGVVDHRWKVLRIYPTEEKPTPDPGRKSERYN